MERYGDTILNDIDNSINIAPLKADLYKCFDNRWFAIVRTRPAKSPRLKIMAILPSDLRRKATTGSVACTSQDERHRGMPLFLDSPEVQIRALIACETHESLKR